MDWSDLPIGRLVIVFLLIVVIATFALAFAMSGGGTSPPSGAPATPATLEPPGARIARTQGCFTCHSTTGERIVGPSWKGIFGQQVTLSDGSTVTVDEAYIRESVLNPTAKVVQGFTPVMPSFQGILSDQDITAITDYIKSLQ